MWLIMVPRNTKAELLGDYIEKQSEVPGGNAAAAFASAHVKNRSGGKVEKEGSSKCKFRRIYSSVIGDFWSQSPERVFASEQIECFSWVDIES